MFRDRKACLNSTCWSVQELSDRSEREVLFGKTGESILVTRESHTYDVP